MVNKSKYSDKIEIIKDNRIQMLEMVKYNIIENKDHLSDSLNEVMKVLYLEEESSKKYESLVKAQNLIIDLTEELVNASSIEDVNRIRNRINYYINKIKTELKRRNISESIILKYQDNIKDIRKNFSKYIRYMKRINNIDKIEDSYSDYDNLTIDERKNFQRMMRNEVKYSKRNKSICSDSYINYINLDSKDNNKDNLNVVIKKVKNESNDYFKYKAVNYSNALEYLYDKVDTFKSTYNILDTIDYSTSRIKNVKIFFKNISNYIANKKSAKKMYSDFSIFYSGNDLKSFYVYVIKRNSIKRGLRAILNPCHLFADEGMYLNQKEKCIEWLFEFCKNNSLNFMIPKSL